MVVERKWFCVTERMMSETFEEEASLNERGSWTCTAAWPPNELVTQVIHSHPLDVAFLLCHRISKGARHTLR